MTVHQNVNASDNVVYPPSADFSRNAHIDSDTYQAMYAASISDPVAFWGEHGKRVDWIQPYTKVKDVSYEFGNVDIKWFEDGTLNVAANCIDRHLGKRADQTAIIWEPDNPEDEALHISYRELLENTCRMA
ncbi:MAG: acetyl-coenzyme A synthetase N-terminal domain-containing protein, partial [Pseudomonadota bacterium]